MRDDEFKNVYLCEPVPTPERGEWCERCGERKAVCIVANSFLCDRCDREVVVFCNECSGPVPKLRRCWATPTCHECLAPPPPLPIVRY